MMVRGVNLEWNKSKINKGKVLDGQCKYHCKEKMNGDDRDKKSGSLIAWKMRNEETTFYIENNSLLLKKVKKELIC